MLDEGDLKKLNTAFQSYVNWRSAALKSTHINPQLDMTDLLKFWCSAVYHTLIHHDYSKLNKLLSIIMTDTTSAGNKILMISDAIVPFTLEHQQFIGSKNGTPNTKSFLKIVTHCEWTEPDLTLAFFISSIEKQKSYELDKNLKLCLADPAPIPPKGALRALSKQHIPIYVGKPDYPFNCGQFIQPLERLLHDDSGGNFFIKHEHRWVQALPVRPLKKIMTAADYSCLTNAPLVHYFVRSGDESRNWHNY